MAMYYQIMTRLYLRNARKYLLFCIRHSPFTIRHSSFTIHHSPFAIRHSSFTIHHSPFAIFLALLLMGCVARFDPDAMQPRAQVIAPPVYDTHTVGQTFVSQRPNLCAIAVAWETTTLPRSPLVLSLRPSPASDQVLARAEIVPEQQQDRAMLYWDFAPLPNAAGDAFYFEISAPQATAENPLRLYKMPHDVYKPGHAHADAVSHTGDLTFHTFYNYDTGLFRQDSARGMSQLWLLLPAAALFLAPGYLLLQLWPAIRQKFDGWSYTGLALGVSLAISPWILLWVTQLGGALAPQLIRLLYWGCGLAALAHLLSPYLRAPARWRATVNALRHNWTSHGHGLLLLLILSVGFIVRLVAIRDLVFPAWVDSVHHALLTQLIAASGRVPTSYAPYISTLHATYHYGFQAQVAFFMHLSGLPLTRAILLVGQIFNIAMALQVYLLARWLTKRRWTALFATLCVALLGTMPAFYVTWGRYTQLAGLLILPVAFILSVEARQLILSLRLQPKAAFLALLLSVCTLAGLILTHYRVFAFYVSLIGAWWLVTLIATPRQWRPHFQTLLIYVGMSSVALALLMPWIGGIAARLWVPAVATWGRLEASAYWDFSWRYVSSGLDRYLLTLGGLGLLIGLVKRERFAGVLWLWLGALFVITNPGLFGLPGEGLINNVAMLITWFIPLAIGSGYLLDLLRQRWQAILPPRWHPWGIGVLCVILLILSGIGIRQQVTIVDPQNLVALQADYAALEWLNAHTAPESHFYINTQLWQKVLYVGSDGGYWIAPLGERLSAPPPVLYALSNYELMQPIHELAQHSKEISSDPARLADLLRAAAVDYVYIGALGGFLDPDILRAAPMFDLCYENERVSIFEVK